MDSKTILSVGVSLMARNPALATRQNVANLRIAAALAWQREEMGGEEHLQFAHRNSTPVVPPGHECHPVELVKRGFIDGKGWPNNATPKISLFRWPDGNHWYASVDGREVIENGLTKWNSPQDAEAAAVRFSASIAQNHAIQSP